MIDISDLKEKVKGLVEGITELSAYYNIVPAGVSSGCLIQREGESYEGRVTEGNAYVPATLFDVLIFTFQGEDGIDACDELTSAFVNAVDGKHSADFQQIAVTDIREEPYDADSGMYGNWVSLRIRPA